MEFSINRSRFIRTLSMVQSIAERKSSMPILSHVCLSARNNEVMAEATDLEVGFQGTCEAEVKTEGTLAVPARKLFEIVREIASETIHFEGTESKWVTISGASASFKLFGLPAEDFPGVPKFEQLDTIEVEAAELHRMIEFTLFAAAVEDTPPYYTSGIYAEKIPEEEGSGLRMVATDGHRLSMVDRSIPGVNDLDFDAGVVISRKGITEVRHLLEESEKVKLGLSKEAGVVMSDHSLVSLRLLAGKYPNYRVAVHSDEPIKVEAERRPLLEMLRRMQIMTTERYRGVRMELLPDSLELFLNNPEVGDAHEAMKITYRHEAMKIGFNPKYFIDVLSIMESEKVTLGFLDMEHGCSIRGEADAGFVGLVMPMQLA